MKLENTKATNKSKKVYFAQLKRLGSFIFQAQGIHLSYFLVKISMVLLYLLWLVKEATHLKMFWAITYFLILCLLLGVCVCVYAYVCDVGNSYVSVSSFITDYLSYLVSVKEIMWMFIQHT